MCIRVAFSAERRAATGDAGPGMGRREDIEAERRRQADEALAGAVRDGEVIGSSTLARAVNVGVERTRAHFGGADADPADAVEIWGRRIGRGLALVAVAALVVHLYLTYLAG